MRFLGFRYAQCAIFTKEINTLMPRMERLDYREIANAKVTTRIKQVGVLILTIVIGILISVSINS
jgi:hypothetical protein